VDTILAVRNGICQPKGRQRSIFSSRHTFASMQADGDANVVALGQFMGRSSAAPRRATSGRRANIT